MELNKIREDTEMIEIELKGESVGFANLLKEELWNDENVDEAAYIKEHPYMAEPKIYVKMKGGRFNTRVALERAVKRLQVKLKSLKRELKRALKD
jgi:DNA-directed RNA polymerase subunit L